MKLCFDKVLNAVEDSIDNVTEDLKIFIEEEDWEEIKEAEYERI